MHIMSVLLIIPLFSLTYLYPYTITYEKRITFLYVFMVYLSRDHKKALTLIWASGHKVNIKKVNW